MAISNFIPSVWRENLFAQLNNNYVGVKHCNREYEGDIIGKGSVVNIPGLETVNIFNYTKGSDMTAPQSAISGNNQLVINQAKAFNFLIDDVDRIQNNPKLMEEAIRNAARALAKTADRYVYSMFEEDNVEDEYGAIDIYNYDTNVDNVIETIIKGINKLYKNDVTSADDLVVEVSPDIAMLIMKAKADLGVNNGDAIESGCIGRINGCKVFVSNNVYVVSGSDGIQHRCFIRTKRAIAFAEQLSEINAYRPEKRFADAVKGLHLYGAKLVRPKEFAIVDLFTPDNGEDA